MFLWTQLVDHQSVPLAKFLHPVLPRPDRHVTTRIPARKHVLLLFGCLASVLSRMPPPYGHALACAFPHHANHHLCRAMLPFRNPFLLSLLVGTRRSATSSCHILVLQFARLEHPEPAKVEHGEEPCFFPADSLVCPCQVGNHAVLVLTFFSNLMTLPL